MEVSLIAAIVQFTTSFSVNCFGLLQDDILIKKPGDTKSIKEFILIKHCLSY